MTEPKLRLPPQIDAADEAKLRAIFKMCDTNGDGTINKRELIKMCRQSFETALFFGLPSVIKQEDGSRAKLEERFQRMDQNDDREVTWEEFHDWYMSEMAAAPKPSTAQTARSSADTAEMAPRASLSLTEELDSETELSPRPQARAGAKLAIASGVVRALTDMVEASEVSETGLQIEDQPVSQERPAHGACKRGFQCVAYSPDSRKICSYCLPYHSSLLGRREKSRLLHH